MDYNYPYTHETVGHSIMGGPAIQHRQTIKGLGMAPTSFAQRQQALSIAAAQRQAYVQSHPALQAAQARAAQIAVARQAAIANRSGAHRVNGLGSVPVARYPRYPYQYPYQNYNNPYGNSGIPYAYYLLLLQQQQQQQNYGVYPYGPYQPQYAYNQYPYQQTQQQYYYVPYQQCVGGGGLWDSFANACTSATSTPSPMQNYPYGTTYPFSGGYPTQPMPSVVGLSMASGVAELNQYGYTVWLVSQDGVPQGTPPGYAPNRAVITVNNNIITSVYQG